MSNFNVVLNWDLENDFEFRCIGYKELLTNILTNQEGHFLGMGGISLTNNFVSSIIKNLLMIYFLLEAKLTQAYFSNKLNVIVKG